MQLSMLFRRTALVLVMAMSFHTLIVPLAGAAMITTETMVATENAGESRAKLVNLLAREDVSSALQAQGVSSDEVLARVNSLTDPEVVKLSQSIDSLPAAGDGVGSVVGAIVFIFLVLLITDLIGLTDVFPFVKKR